MKTLIDPRLVQSAMDNMEITDLNDASIRQISAIVRKVAESTTEEFIHFEIGVPGLKPSEIGTTAEKAAIDRGVCSKYVEIDGCPELKTQASRFIKAFIDTDIAPEHCIPTVGSMQGSFAAMLACSQVDAAKDTILFIDPGFSVQKNQAEILGIKKASFDLVDFRGELLRDKLESYLRQGNIAAIIYSNPNNPSWMCLTEGELEIIGQMADKYDTIIIEDLAYLAMDFRKTLGRPFEPPYQSTVSRYTDKYIMLVSSSKIFSYAGQRVAIAAISDKLFERHYDNLSVRFGMSKFGSAFVHRIIYATTAGTAHSPQHALAAMFKAACDGRLDFVSDVNEYARRSARLKEIFIRNGFHIVYDTDLGEELSDGFYFTVGYGDMNGGEVLKELLSYCISGVTLKLTGSVRQGLRICSSAVMPHHFELLEKRLEMFDKENRGRKKLTL